MPHRFVWKRLKNFFIHRVLHVDDTPHRIALGVADRRPLRVDLQPFDTRAHLPAQLLRRSVDSG